MKQQAELRWKLTLDKVELTPEHIAIYLKPHELSDIGVEQDEELGRLLLGVKNLLSNFNRGLNEKSN